MNKQTKEEVKDQRNTCMSKLMKKIGTSGC